MKTKFDSYCVKGFAKGCRYCVDGKKLVLFISGVCSRNCWYCSLSNKRKNKDFLFANERRCKNIKEIFEEIKESRATSAGITGGDPLLFINRTVRFASELKKKFGGKFHIHIYLPTKFVDRQKLRKLSKHVDEVRFHPEFLLNDKLIHEDINKISLASQFWDKEEIGIELPMIPDKKKEILEFILQIQNKIGFVNLNEFELSETNFDRVSNEYKLKEGGYVVAGSLEAGKWILKELQKIKTSLKIHLCTAELKNCQQFKNRLKRHIIFPYGKQTEDGTVIYLAIYAKGAEEFKRLQKNIPQGIGDDKKKRIILPEELARKLSGKYKIERVEEFPTYDRIEVEREEI